jgi:hypothetical protein
LAPARFPLQPIRGEISIRSFFSNSLDSSVIKVAQCYIIIIIFFSNVKRAAVSIKALTARPTIYLISHILFIFFSSQRQKKKFQFCSRVDDECREEKVTPCLPHHYMYISGVCLGIIPF